MSAGYSEDELVILRGSLVGFRALDAPQRQRIAEAVVGGDCAPHLAPFYPLGEDFPQLFRRLSADVLLESYGPYALFPRLYESIYENNLLPEIAFDGRTRGQVAIFRFVDGTGLVVKPWQSGREGGIAALAAAAGVGPTQYPSLEGFLVEEFVPGCFFTELPKEWVDEESMYRVGRRLGQMMAELHARKIYYNDATLSDPEGRSHLMVDFSVPEPGGEAPSCRLIDFGVSVLLDRFPDLNMEEVYNLVRTTPEFRLFSGMGLGARELRKFLVQYRQRLVSASAEEIMARDLRFTEEGLRYAASRLGQQAVVPLEEGFASGYGGSV